MLCLPLQIQLVPAPKLDLIISIGKWGRRTWSWSFILLRSWGASGAIHNLHEASEGLRSLGRTVRGAEVHGETGLGVPSHESPARHGMIAMQGLQHTEEWAQPHLLGRLHINCRHDTSASHVIILALPCQELGMVLS